MGGGDAGTAAHQRHDSHDGNHRHPNARAHEGECTRSEREPISAIPSALVIRQQHLRESECQRAGERDLKRRQDVLHSGAEHQELSRHDRRHPRPDRCTPHQRPAQCRDHDVQRHAEHLVGNVGTGTEHGPQRPPHDNGQRGPVLVVRAEQVTDAPRVAASEKTPLVEIKPPVPAEEQIRPRRQYGKAGESHQRRTRSVGRLSGVAHGTAPKRARCSLHRTRPRRSNAWLLPNSYDADGRRAAGAAWRRNYGHVATRGDTR